MSSSPGIRCLLTMLCVLCAHAEGGNYDEKLIGSWIAPQSVVIKDGQSEEDAEQAALRQPGNTLVWVFRADHTWSTGKMGEPPVMGGWWRVEGSELTTGVQVGTPREPERVQIVLLDEQRLTVAADGIEGHWRRLPKDI